MTVRHIILSDAAILKDDSDNDLQILRRQNSRCRHRNFLLFKMLHLNIITNQAICSSVTTLQVDDSPTQRAESRGIDCSIPVIEKSLRKA